MLGALLGLASAAAFGANWLFARRGMRRVSSNYIANVSILSGPVFFLLICVFTGEISNLGRFTWKVYLFFALSGVIHFALGRTFGYRANQLIGMTRANMITGMSSIVTVIEAVIVLGENLTPVMALGIFLSMSGPLLLALRESTVSAGIQTVGGGAGVGAIAYGRDVDRRTLHVGVLFGVGAAIFWGSSAVFIKLALENGGSPIAGSLIAYTAASCAISYSLLSREIRRELFTWDPISLRMALGSGVNTNMAQLLRFSALAFAPAIVVALMQRTTPIWVLIIAFLFERRTESFSPWVLLGNALLIAGTILVVV